MFATSVCSISLCFLTVVTVEKKSWLVLGILHTPHLFGGWVRCCKHLCVIAVDWGALSSSPQWLQRVVVLRSEDSWG